VPRRFSRDVYWPLKRPVPRIGEPIHLYLNSLHSTMIVAVLRETYPGERRVALVPFSVAALVKIGMRVQVEAKAGLAAGFTGDSYADAGAEVIDDREQIIRSADMLLQVRGLGANPHAGAADLAYMQEGLVVVAPCDPLGNPAAVTQLA